MVLLPLAGGTVDSIAAIPMQKLLSRSTVTPENNIFGGAVALSGSFLAVGEHNSDDVAPGAGSVTLFSGSTGSYLRRLKAVDGAAFDSFGGAVALSGNRVLVGAKEDDDSRGSAYVFDATTGRQLRKLVASDGVAGDEFGNAVALSGNLALVGSLEKGSGLGSAYLFDIGTGVQLGILVPTGEVGAERFGVSVALTPQLAVVGASDSNLEQGAVYVYDVQTRTQLKRIVASDAVSNDRFGQSVSLFGNLLLAGSNGGASNKGAAYLFSAPLGTELRKFTVFDGAAGDGFGFSVSLTQDLALIGSRIGRAYLFDVRRGISLNTYVLGELGTRFGETVAVSGNQILIGDFYDDTRGSNAGAAYLIRNQASSRPLSVVATKGAFAEGAGSAKYGTLSPPVVSASGATSFVSTLTGSGAGTGTLAKGLWKEDGGVHSLFGRKLMVVEPETGLLMDNFKAPIFNDDADVLFEMTIRDSPSRTRPAVISRSSFATGLINRF